ncbi:hypothetical protein ACM1RC_26695 [Paenibacillus azoreducens]|uniref:hypothetical protein n=1 Tax=Paenibacillus azoreducens TaxID=116718 RepID=UPI0039F5431B
MITQAKKQEIVNKHAKKFAAKDTNGPLDGVHYATDGSIVVTNRYIALIVSDAHSSQDSFTSHVVTGMQIDGAYPSLSRVVPSKWESQIIWSGDQIKEVIQAVKLAFETAKTEKPAVSYLNVNSHMTAFINTDTKQRGLYFSGQIGKADKTFSEVHFNPEFLLNALNVYKDAGSQEVVLKLTGRSMSPVVLSDENGIDIIILPFRVAK